jgi:hypothetical protein
MRSEKCLTVFEQASDRMLELIENGQSCDS